MHSFDHRSSEADVVVVEAGLAGLLAAVELADAGRRVIVTDQELEQNIGGQVYWAFGGLSIVGWAERGGHGRLGHGNSVPRFHITWGTGPGVLEPFVRRVRAAQERGLIALRFRHRVDDLTVTGGRVTGVRGTILEPSTVGRGRPSSRAAVGEVAFTAGATIIASGGIGANHDLIRQNLPPRLGTPPDHILTGVPGYVDGRLLAITEAAGGTLINRDRMWHYTEGIQNWNPLWSRHGVRILPGLSSLWLDARGRRLPVPIFPGFDTLATLTHLRQAGYDYSWFVLAQRIMEREFALSGSDQNPEFTRKSLLRALGRTLLGAPGPMEAFKQRGVDFNEEAVTHGPTRSRI